MPCTPEQVRMALRDIFAALGAADPEKRASTVVNVWAVHCAPYSPAVLNTVSKNWAVNSDTAPTLSSFLTALRLEHERSPAGRKEATGCADCRGSGRRYVYGHFFDGPGSAKARGREYVAACPRCEAGRRLSNYGKLDDVMDRLEKHPLVDRQPDGRPCVWCDSAQKTILQVQAEHRPGGAAPPPQGNPRARSWLAMAEAGAREPERPRWDEDEDEGGSPW